MKIKRLALSVMVCLGSGFTALPHAALAASAALPNCFDSNYDRALGLFTLKNAVKNQVNQQCLLTVGQRGGASSSRLAAGRYQVSLSNGGGETTATVVTRTGKLATSQPTQILPTKGALGSGGGGGEGSSVTCAAGAAGGHGFIRFQPI